VRKFWLWMSVKEYACVGISGWALCVPGQPLAYPINQMLIGYMLEYIREAPGHPAGYCYRARKVEKVVIGLNMYHELESIIKEMDGEE
jgi:hypothetical protein